MAPNIKSYEILQSDIKSPTFQFDHSKRIHYDDLNEAWLESDRDPLRVSELTKHLMSNCFDQKIIVLKKKNSQINFDKFSKKRKKWYEVNSNYGKLFGSRMIRPD